MNCQSYEANSEKCDFQNSWPSIDWQLSQVPVGQFCSNFDVKISTSNFGFDGGIPVFLVHFRKKWELCKDNYSKSFFSTTHENCLKTSKLNKKWISQQIFSIFTEMYSGNSIVWHYIGLHGQTFFKSYHSLKMGVRGPGHNMTILLLIRELIWWQVWIGYDRADATSLSLVHPKATHELLKPRTIFKHLAWQVEEEGEWGSEFW